MSLAKADPGGGWRRERLRSNWSRNSAAHASKKMQKIKITKKRIPQGDFIITGLDAGHADVAANKQFHNDSAIKLQNLDEEPSLLNKAAKMGQLGLA